MTRNLAEMIEGLPGADLVLEGLGDYHAGRHSIPACLVRMARPRLIRAGMMTASPPRDDGAELELYQLISSSGGPRSFSRYNALVFYGHLPQRCHPRSFPVTAR